MSVKKYIVFAIVVMIITFCWIGLEYCLDGEIISQHSDSIFALLLGYFITNWIDEKYVKL